MPPEIGEGGPLGLVPWQMDAGSLVVEQALGPRVKAFLIEAAPGHDDPVVVVQRPQAVVEQPVGVLAQGQAVARVVVARGGKLMDMGRVDDALAGDGGQPISRQRARERVVGQHRDPEPRIAAFLRRFGDGLVADLLRDRILVGNLYVAEGVQRGPVLRVEVPRDQQRPGAPTKPGIARGREEPGINQGVTRPVPLAGGLLLLVEDLPETLAPEME